ncbi:glycosyltransferase [Mobilicoccus pelagius]|uniref:D-inositol 3-phosphate glycosyltransferase n=1 Tax=Mobilicoccus pelagius NBRC 104925 TaxID=1089455 RepID=H5UMV8_9MICO|nr:glycosyltransferase [Mobilicoccus pelagius]GAB47066.1 glycosyltransferase [Mobilicoccus pelagius NBRC 104925]
MRVAIVAGEYPTSRAPERAMFVRDQVDALRAAGHDVTVVHHEPPTLRRAVTDVRRRRAVTDVRRRRAERRAAASTSTPVAGRRASVTVSSASTTAPSPAPAVVAPGTAPSPSGSAGKGASARLRTAGRVLHDRAGQAAAAAAMRRDLRRLDPAPEVVHAHNVFPAGAAAVRFGRERDVPVVVTEHSSAFRRDQLAPSEIARARRIYEACAAVVAVSPSQAAALPAEDVVVVGNVVPAGFGLRRPEAARSGDLVSIGTLRAHKGMDALVRAYAILPAHVRDRHHLVLVGDGPEAPRLAALVAELGLTGRVRLTGHVARDRVATILRGAALVVSASPVETFGVTLLEGLSAGVPFVAVRSGGPESVWFPGAGVLVPTGSPENLALGLEAALTPGTDECTTTPDEDRRRVAQDRFGGPAVAARLSALYRAATAAPGDRTGR